jgi:hypothetical protein
MIMRSSLNPLLRDNCGRGASRFLVRMETEMLPPGDNVDEGGRLLSKVVARLECTYAHAVKTWRSGMIMRIRALASIGK